ncbi:MAG TPA: hypothetical protein VM534_01725, partial [Thermoanaerobaculia bacterium]|nr:hypothetical protein [Thermoanaerobaculia bacterium]
SPEVPHGGVKESGSGRSHGNEGLLECVRTRTIMIEPWSGWPETYWQTGSRRVSDGLRAFIELAHGTGFLSRVRAAWRTLKLLHLTRDRKP